MKFDVPVPEAVPARFSASATPPEASEIVIFWSAPVKPELFCTMMPLPAELMLAVIPRAEFELIWWIRSPTVWMVLSTFTVCDAPLGPVIWNEPMPTPRPSLSEDSGVLSETY